MKLLSLLHLALLQSSIHFIKISTYVSYLKASYCIFTTTQETEQILVLMN